MAYITLGNYVADIIESVGKRAVAAIIFFELSYAESQIAAMPKNIPV